MARCVLYLHGFASGPGSHKGRAFEAFLGERGYRVERLDLRVPSRDQLRISEMIAVTERAAVVHNELAVVGSSLGGLVAAHVAARLPSVLGSVLMAPAFRFAERWASALGAEQLERWRAGVPLRVDDHAGGPPLQLDYGFFEDAVKIDRDWPPLLGPALVFHGRADETVDIATSRAFVERASNARLVELDDEHRLVDSLPVILANAHPFLDRLWRTDA